MAPSDAGADPAPIERDAGRPDHMGEQDAGREESPPRCPDLDENGRLDCVESLLINPAFTKGLRGWIPEVDVPAEWSARDGVDNPGSGSLFITNAVQSDSTANGFVAVAQCLALSAGRYLIFTQVWIDQPNPSGSAGLTATVFDDDACEGEEIETEMLLTIATNEWVPLGRSVVVPTRGRSMKVRLGVLKPFPAEASSAFIDNVLLRPE